MKKKNLFSGKSLSSMQRRSFAQSVEEELDNAGLTEQDPAKAFSDFSFKVIPRDNWLRKTCIRVVLSPWVNYYFFQSCQITCGISLLVPGTILPIWHVPHFSENCFFTCDFPLRVSRFRSVENVATRLWNIIPCSFLLWHCCCSIFDSLLSTRLNSR